jgi:hypothetical protein
MDRQRFVQTRLTAASPLIQPGCTARHPTHCDTTEETPMTDDPRCCGSGTCIIDSEGRCWCGQRWDGEKMCFEPTPGTTTGQPAADDSADSGASEGGD